VQADTRMEFNSRTIEPTALIMFVVGATEPFQRRRRCRAQGDGPCGWTINEAM
jgi:hypothetical protein